MKKYILYIIMLLVLIQIVLATPTGLYCTTLYDPVCGSDGRTYSNGCYASNAGVSYTQGSCEQQSESTKLIFLLLLGIAFIIYQAKKKK